MSEPIKDGDMVVVVRWPCCAGDIGYVFRVAEIITRTDVAICSFCRSRKGNTGMPIKARSESGALFPLQWLKRIPPLSELDDIKKDEEITA